jgi:hypothetical protein
VVFTADVTVMLSYSLCLLRFCIDDHPSAGRNVILSNSLAPNLPFADLVAFLHVKDVEAVLSGKYCI